MESKLNSKQRKFLKHYLEHHNLAAAAKYAGSEGHNTKCLSEVGSRLLDSVGMSFQEKLDAYGLTDARLMQTINEGLQAKRLFLASYQGKFLDERKDDDHPTRSKYAELLGRMKGVFIDKHELTGKDGGDIVLEVVSAKTKRSVKDLDID